MNKKYTRYNEREYAEKVWQDGFQSRNKTYEIELLTKLLSEKGGSKKEVEQGLISFCEKNQPNFSYVKEFPKIDNAIKKSYLEPFVVVAKIDITRGELIAIDTLKVDETKSKILLSMIFKIKLAKAIKREEVKNDNWVFYGNYKNYNELKRISKMSTRQNVHQHIYKMNELGIVQPYLGGSVRLSFLENNDLLDDTEVYETITISNYEYVGYVWERYKGTHRIRNCEHCNVYMRAKSNSHKYCKQCGEEINREKARLSFAERYSNAKNL